MAGSSPQITAVISANDQASAVLKAIAKLAGDIAKDIEKTGQTNRFSGLSSNLDAATQAAKRHSDALAKVKSDFGDLLKLAATYAAIKAPQLTRETTKQGMQLQHEQRQLINAGIPQSELKDAERQVLDVTRKEAPNVSVNSGLETYKELRSVLKDLHEVPHLLPTVLRAKSVLEAQGIDTHGLGLLVKGAEVAGIANDPERFKRYMDANVRAMQVMGKTINPEQLYEFEKYAKASGLNLSDKFRGAAGMGLIQELGGSTAGVATNQFIKQIIGGFQGNLHAAAKEFVALGLANKDDFEKTKAGEIKGLKAGKRIDGADVAQRDPAEYVYKYLLPALQKHGFDTQEKQLAEVRRLFPNSNAADLVSKLIVQKEAFENHAKLYAQALGLQADAMKDATVATKAMGTALQDAKGQFSNALAEPIAGVAAEVADKLKGFAGWFHDFTKQHPTAAKGIAGTVAVGGEAVGLAGKVAGLALTASAYKLLTAGGSLVGAAASLEAAALTMRAGGVTGAVAGGAGAVAAGGAGAAAGGAATAAARGGIVGRALAPLTSSLVGEYAGAGLAGTIGGTVLGVAELAALGYFVYQGMGGGKTDAANSITKELVEANRRLQTLEHVAQGKESRGEDASSTRSKIAQLEADIERLNGYKRRLDNNEAPSVFAGGVNDPRNAMRLPASVAAHEWKPDKWNTAVPAVPHGWLDRVNDARPQNVSVSGELSGHAELMTTVRVDPSPLLLAKVENGTKPVQMPVAGKIGQTMKGSNAAVGSVSAGAATFKPTVSGR